MDASEYVRQLGLDEDDEEDVREEIANVKEAWRKIDEKQNPETLIALLIEDLKIANSASIISEIGLLNPFNVDTFVDWYVRWLFKEDDGEDVVDQEEDNSKSSAAVGWGKFALAGTVEGEQWRCSTCRIVNQWEVRKCIGCDSLAPHAAELQETSTISSLVNEKAKIGSSGFMFGGGLKPTPGGGSAPVFTPFPAFPTPASVGVFSLPTAAASTSSISSSGFSFKPTSEIEKKKEESL